MGIANRVALITGSASGMGKQTARRMAENGAAVVINDIDPAKVEATVAEFRQDRLNVAGVVADISNRDAVEAMVSKTVAEFGGLDILVNNAGLEKAGPLRKLSDADWNITVNVNLKGTFLCSQVAHGHMVQNKHGRIINIASRAWLGGAGQAPYASAKAGVVGMTRTLALELGRNGVTTNCIAPGLIHTPMWAFPDQPPFGTGTNYTDHVMVPTHTLFGIMAVLLEREVTGRGQTVAVSQLESAISMVPTDAMAYGANGEVLPPLGYGDPDGVPHGIYKTQGYRRWIAIAVFSNEEWAALKTVIGQPWAEDARFSTPESRHRHKDELDERIERWTSHHDADALMGELLRAGVKAGMVKDARDVIEDEHLRQRGFWGLSRSSRGGIDPL